MFNTNFDHENSNLVEACGFDHEYFQALLNGMRKIHQGSMRTSLFIEAAENQILGNSEVPSNIQIAVRMLLVLATMSEQLFESHSVKKVVLKSGKKEIDSLQDFIENLKEAMEESLPEEFVKEIHKKKRSKKKSKKEEE